MAGEGVAGTEVGAARRGRRADPGGGAPDLTTGAAAERDGAVAHRPARRNHVWVQSRSVDQRAKYALSQGAIYMSVSSGEKQWKTNLAPPAMSGVK